MISTFAFLFKFLSLFLFFRRQNFCYEMSFYEPLLKAKRLSLFAKKMKRLGYGFSARQLAKISYSSSRLFWHISKLSCESCTVTTFGCFRCQCLVESRPSKHQAIHNMVLFQGIHTLIIGMDSSRTTIMPIYDAIWLCLSYAWVQLETIRVVYSFKFLSVRSFLWWHRTKLGKHRGLQNCGFRAFFIQALVFTIPTAYRRRSGMPGPGRANHVPFHDFRVADCIRIALDWISFDAPFNRTGSRMLTLNHFKAIEKKIERRICPINNFDLTNQLITSALLMNYFHCSCGSSSRIGMKLEK